MFLFVNCFKIGQILVKNNRESKHVGILSYQGASATYELYLLMLINNLSNENQNTKKWASNIFNITFVFYYFFRFSRCSYIIFGTLFLSQINNYFRFFVYEIDIETFWDFPHYLLFFMYRYKFRSFPRILHNSKGIDV